MMTGKNNKPSYKHSMENLRIFMILWMALGLFACRDLVQDEFPPFDPVPVLNAIVAQGEPVSVQVSMAQKIDSFPIVPIPNAEVKLFTNGVFSGQLMYDQESGAYRSDTLARAGSVYRCEVEVPGHPLLVATDSLPTPLPVLGISHVSYAGKDEEGTVFPMVKVTFSNNPSVRCYFEAKIRYKWGDEAKIHTIIDPVILNEGLPLALFSNEIISDSSYTLVLNYTSGGSSSSNGGIYYTNMYPFVIELRTVSYSYYRYWKQYYLYQQARYSDMLLSNQSAFPLYSNVENGYGIFAGYSTFVSDTITPEPYVR